MDYLPSDLVSMSKEISSWQTEYTSISAQLDSEIQKTEEDFERLQSQLVEVENEIELVDRHISSANIRLTHNEQWIQHRILKLFQHP